MYALGSGALYEVHRPREPQCGGVTNYIAHVDLAPFGLDEEMEQLWLRQRGDDRFSLCCIPFRAYGLALDDVVGLSADGTITRLVRRSGRRFLRILFMPVPGLADLLQQIRGEVSRLGLMSEWSGDRHIAIDVPPGVEVDSIRRFADRVWRLHPWLIGNRQTHCRSRR